MSFGLVSHGRGHAPTQIPMSTVTLTGSVILNMSHELHEPQFLHPESGHKKYSFHKAIIVWVYLHGQNLVM